MSFDRSFALALVLLVGCAGFRRGEYWEEDTDAAPGDAGGPGSSSAGPGDSGEPQTSDGSASTGEAGSETSTGTAAGPSFAADILPLLRAGCQRCHAADGSANTTGFLLDVDDDTAYAMTLAFVDVDNPSASRLLAKTAGSGHTGGVIYDDRSAEYDAILVWIEYGALP